MTNTTAMDILVHVFLCAYVLISSGFKPRSRITEYRVDVCSLLVDTAYISLLGLL